jgi:heptaprenyl diphosphate synthase
VIIPIPGVKLGLANLAVMLVFFTISKADAAIVSFIRVLLVSLLFGTSVSFIMSFLGALFSYASMFSVSYLFKKEKISFIGVSILSAVLHGIGQLVGASLIYTAAVFSYLPVLVIGGTVMGCVSGVITNLIYKRIENVKNA